MEGVLVGYGVNIVKTMGSPCMHRVGEFSVSLISAIPDLRIATLCLTIQRLSLRADISMIWLSAKALDT